MQKHRSSSITFIDRTVNSSLLETVSDLAKSASWRWFFGPGVLVPEPGCRYVILNAVVILGVSPRIYPQEKTVVENQELWILVFFVAAFLP
jgi:hypothetical protein